MFRKLAITSILFASLAAIGEVFALELPTVSWLFSFGSTTGWIFAALLLIFGLYLLIACPKDVAWTPVTLARFARFKSITRGWWSFKILIFLVLLAVLDQALVGKRALWVSYEGKQYFPAFVKARYPASTFGQVADGETNYRQLKEAARENDKLAVLMPALPWAPVLDSDDQQTLVLETREGLLYKPGNEAPYSGRAVRKYEGSHQNHTDLRVRRGLPDGEWLSYTEDGALISRAYYRKGNKERENLTGEITPEQFKALDTKAGPLTVTLYPPIPPLWKAKHFLGTDSRGWDVLAQIYGGWQLNLKAIIIYISLTYFIGIMIGTLMGFWSGWFDTILQRCIEILEQLPFLYIVMIVVSIVSVANMNLSWLLGVLCIFSWTGITYTLRALTYKEKERDYISAARLQGASTWRIITRYILPNILSTLVTVIPFSIVGIIATLTALSFVGFGLPETYPSWGWLFDDGISHLSAYWITLSMFFITVLILLLFTFVGEALREAFDPKKFSTYQ